MMIRTKLIMTPMKKTPTKMCEHVDPEGKRTNGDDADQEQDVNKDAVDRRGRKKVLTKMETATMTPTTTMIITTASTMTTTRFRTH
jgi:hypothetical protein